MSTTFPIKQRSSTTTCTSTSDQLRKRSISISLEVSSAELLASKLLNCSNSDSTVAESKDSHLQKPLYADDTRLKEKAWKRKLPWWHKNRLTFYNFDQLPEFLKDNSDIRSGYRAYYTFKEIWISLFHLHNDSNNIWSHIISFIYFIFLVIHVWSDYQVQEDPVKEHSFRNFLSAQSVSLHPNTQWSDRVVITMYLLCAMTCFLFSSLFHLHLCHSPKILHRFGCLDYSGISILILGSTFTIAYYLFYCQLNWQVFWLSALTICNFGGVIGPAFSVWTKPRFRPFRTLVYVTAGTMGIFPILQYSIISSTNLHSSMSYLVLPATEFWTNGILFTAFCYLFGALIYVGRLPERLLPGYFDYFGASHQIWHLFVFLGAYFHFHFSVWMLNWRLQTLESTLGVCPTTL